jgi:hypothetical protein
MAKLWQLKCLSSGESLNEPQLLPENWGPVFGLANLEDKLGDLAWIGPDHVDTGWFHIGDEPPPPEPASREDLIRQEAWDRLRECDYRVLPDEPIPAGKRAEWIEYRRELRRIHKTEHFPLGFELPKAPYDII